MNKIIHNIRWVLVGLLVLAFIILLFAFNSLLRASIQQTRNQQVIEKNFISTQTAYDVRVESLLNELDKAKAARDVYADQLQEAENKLACPRRDLFKPDYIFDKEMEAALMVFLNKTEAGEVKSAKHELVWPGLGLVSRTTLFSLNMVNGENEFLYKFIVYHNDRFFAKNRVFSIAKQCWLDG
jgi:hypothetical protein